MATAQDEGREAAGAALIIIDVINDLDFPEGDQLLQFARPMADRLLPLRERATAAGLPVIYANDNFGRWRSDLRSLVERCLAPEIKGRELVEKLQPREDDYIVLKPRHSAFYGTPLDFLIEQLKVRTLILTGVAGNICVYFTAYDAYLRGLKLIVPPDCTASNSAQDNRESLAQMERVLKAEMAESEQLTVERLRSLRELDSLR